MGSWSTCRAHSTSAPSILRFCVGNDRETSPTPKGSCGLRIPLLLRLVPYGRKCTSRPASARDTRFLFRGSEKCSGDRSLVHAGFIVRYGRSHWPNTPRRLKSRLCASMKPAANSRHIFRNSPALLFSSCRRAFSRPVSRWAGRGNPIRECKGSENPPLSWTSPPCLSRFCSGPCRDGFRPLDTEGRREARRAAHFCEIQGCGDTSLSCSHAANCSGSRSGNFAFIGKSVLGRFRVLFRSSCLAILWNLGALS